MKDQLGLFLKDEIIRCASCYGNLSLLEETKSTVLSHHDGEITKLIFEVIYQRLMHMGMQSVLAEFRKK